MIQTKWDGPIKIQIRGIRKLHKDLGLESKRQKKALETAIKVEGFRRLLEIREEIRKGGTGGKQWQELSEIAKRTKAGNLRKRQVPLYRIARMLRYNVTYNTGFTGIGGIQFSFGFLTRGHRPIQSSYKQMLVKHEDGTDVLYRNEGRRDLGIRFARIGAKLEKKGDPDAKYFFLRKTTGRRVKLPSREITKPYWDRNRDAAMESIRRNYRLKLQGNRI